MLSTDGCSTRVPGLVNFGLQTPEIYASYYCFFFQGRTGCGGRPSGWHDIVTGQRLVTFAVIQHTDRMTDRPHWSHNLNLGAGNQTMFITPFLYSPVHTGDKVDKTAKVADLSPVCRKSTVAGSFDFVDRVAVDIVDRVEHVQPGRLCRKWVILSPECRTSFRLRRQCVPGFTVWP